MSLFIIGLINNSAYVVILSSSKSITKKLKGEDVFPIISGL